MTKELPARSKSYNARTRTLIQIGGLFDKAGLLPYFDLTLGDDLQRDEHTFDAAATLLGALLEFKTQLQDKSDDSDQYLWRLKGKRALQK